ncbi:NAD(P)-dependent oxidoreductase [Gluconacetobacter takamatsuzukensis]|uniref:Glyoxylate reductase (NADP(+)) n=1 Tax=Gluconacetobacter takamatsuzukensis TaxID=1286190 RepID=A0A7W4KF80_9PROT|nr:NAD(P)-dependent oxidoreductase [Gluconacetobacter takamatsuzukensis]MBB2205828.1 glyoxylate reductase (NADP(+)) [Gluconacetobacter takamatsuzukensis]
MAVECVDTRLLRAVNQAGPRGTAAFARFSDRIALSEAAHDAPAPWDVAGADILVTGPFAAWKNAPADPPPGWGRGPRWVQIVSAGVDAFPDWLLRDRVVTCGRGNAAVPIAEYVLAALLLHEKRFDALRPASAAEWRAQAGPLQRGVTLGSLEGRTVGLAGYGAIGHAVAARARAFGMRVLAWRSRPWTAEETALVEPAASLGELAARADHLVLALPLTARTRNIVDGPLLAGAKPGLHLVNVARGGLVDEAALLAALDAGRIGAATLDVTSQEPLPDGHPFYRHPRVRLTPHVSWSGPEVAAAGTRRIEENIARFLAGEPLLDVVDPVRGY